MVSEQRSAPDLVPAFVPPSSGKNTVTPLSFVFHAPNVEIVCFAVTPRARQVSAEGNAAGEGFLRKSDSCTAWDGKAEHGKTRWCSELRLCTQTSRHEHCRIEGGQSAEADRRPQLDEGSGGATGDGARRGTQRTHP